jgi:hypothetical protein
MIDWTGFKKLFRSKDRKKEMEIRLANMEKQMERVKTAENMDPELRESLLWAMRRRVRKIIREG